MTHQTFRARLARRRVIAILRGVPDEQLLPTVAALQTGGIELVEVALGGEADFERISRLVAAFPGLLIGAGTVVSAQLAEQAVRAGAAFLLTPHVAEGAIQAAARLGVPIIPGALTPTEIQRCLDLGCAAVKLFPASLGGPDYLRALRAPYPQLPIVAVGGVSAETAPAYLQAGALAVGLGSDLTRMVGPAPDYAAVQTRAHAVLAKISTS